MKKFLMTGSLVFSVVLYGYFLETGDGEVLVPVLLGLLVSFTCAMLFLTDKWWEASKSCWNTLYRKSSVLL